MPTGVFDIISGFSPSSIIPRHPLLLLLPTSYHSFHHTFVCYDLLYRHLSITTVCDVVYDIRRSTRRRLSWLKARTIPDLRRDIEQTNSDLPWKLVRNTRFDSNYVGGIRERRTSSDDTAIDSSGLHQDSDYLRSTTPFQITD